jgi:OST-HTH/LOTUS domain
VLYYATRTAAAAGQQQEDRAPAVVVASYCNSNKNTGRQGKTEHQQLDELPNAISASSTMDSLSTVGSDGHEHHHAEDAPTTTAAAAALRPTRRPPGLAKFEDQLVKIIQAAPGQRIMQLLLRRDYKNEWTSMRRKKFEALVGTLKKVKIVKIYGTKFVVRASFDPLVDVPPANQEVLKRLEDELVELVRSSDNHRIPASRKSLEKAYQQKYKKPLKLDQTGFYTINNAVQAMPRLARSTEYKRMLIEAPSMPRRFDDAPLPPPSLTRARAAQQYSGRPPTVSAALPPTHADPYARSSDLPPPHLPPGHSHGLSPTRSENSAHAAPFPGLPPGLPHGLPTGFGVPESVIPDMSASN